MIESPVELLGVIAPRVFVHISTCCARDLKCAISTAAVDDHNPSRKTLDACERFWQIVFLIFSEDEHGDVTGLSNHALKGFIGLICTDPARRPLNRGVRKVRRFAAITRDRDAFNCRPQKRPSSEHDQSKLASSGSFLLKPSQSGSCRLMPKGLSDYATDSLCIAF